MSNKTNASLEHYTQMSMMIDIYGSFLTKRQNETMVLYYYDNLSLSEIAENLDITRQAVHMSIVRSEKIFNELETKLCIISKNKQCIEKLDEILSYTKQIIDIADTKNDAGIDNNIIKIDKLTNSIKELLS